VLRKRHAKAMTIDVRSDNKEVSGLESRVLMFFSGRICQAVLKIVESVVKV